MNRTIKQNAKGVALLLQSTKGTIYTFGNGGSSSIADHMACDWMKSAEANLRVISLSCNNSLLSAISNDFGYERTCAAQLLWLANNQDTLVLISSSGKSPNIIEGLKVAREIGMYVIGFSGFSGTNQLNDDCDYGVHIESEDYGVIENYHTVIMHEVVRQLRKTR
jgi:phosphoheptose isomerase